MNELLTVVSNIWSALFGGGTGDSATTGFIGMAIRQPILLIPIGFGFAGGIVGLFRRMTRIGGRRGRG